MAMAATDLVTALDSVAARKSKAKAALEGLDSKRPSLASKTLVSWKDLNDHWSAAETSLRARLQELLAKERSWEQKKAAAEASLAKRTAAVVALEESASARVQALKSDALSLVEAEKTKQSPAISAAVESAVKAALETVQERIRNEPPDSILPVALDLNPLPVSAQSKPKKTTNLTQLKLLCKSGDGGAVRQCLTRFKKRFAGLPAALEGAPDPATLVLQAMEGYCSTSIQTETKGKQLAIRHACINLLEALTELKAKPGKESMVSLSLSMKAKQLADKLKPQLKFEIDSSSGFSMDAQCFLQFLATFGLSSYLSEKEQCDLVCTIAKRKQTPAICRLLGLTAKIPEIVERLEREGKTVDAATLKAEFVTPDQNQSKTPGSDPKKATQDASLNPAGSRKANPGKEDKRKTIDAPVSQQAKKSRVDSNPTGTQSSQPAKNSKPVSGQPVKDVNAVAAYQQRSKARFGGGTNAPPMGGNTDLHRILGGGALSTTDAQLPHGFPGFVGSASLSSRTGPGFHPFGGTGPSFGAGSSNSTTSIASALVKPYDYSTTVVAPAFGMSTFSNRGAPSSNYQTGLPPPPSSIPPFQSLYR